MKKLISLLLVAGMLMTFTGCKDAAASLSNGSEVVLTVGKTTITKQDFYNQMMASDGGLAIINAANSLIFDAEIETTPEIKNEAKVELESIKSEIAEEDDYTFEDFLDDYYDGSEEKLMETCINVVKGRHLITKYFDEKQSELVKTFHPVKAKLLYFAIDTNDKNKAFTDAKEAQKKISEGATFEDVSAEYKGSKYTKEQLYVSSSSVDYAAWTYMASVDSPGLSSPFLDKSEKGYYICQVTVTNFEQLKSDFIKYLQEDDEFNEEVYSHFYEKHNFTVYDIDVYNLLKNNYPSYLVQK